MCSCIVVEFVLRSWCFCRIAVGSTGIGPKQFASLGSTWTGATAIYQDATVCQSSVSVQVTASNWSKKLSGLITFHCFSSEVAKFVQSIECRSILM